MGCVILTGANFNLFARSGVSVSVSPAADALFPATNLYDRVPGNIFRWGSLTTPNDIILDLTDGLGGFGGLNSWTGGTPSGWTEVNSGGGTVTQDGVTTQEGAASALFTPGAGGTASLKITASDVRSGWWYRLQQYTFNTGAVTLALNVSIQNLTTGKWWNGSAWQAAQVVAGQAGPNGAWTQQSITFQMESYAESRADTVQLEITYAAPNSTDVINLDRVDLLPGVDFASIHGHNSDPLVAVTFRSSTDGFLGSDTSEATMTPQLGAFYTILSSRVYRRYWGLRFTGTNTSASGAIYLGEAVISQSFTLSRGPDYPIRLRFATPQIRVPLPYGAGAVYPIARHPMIGVGLNFRQTEAQFSEFFHEVFARSISGAPLVVVPDTNDALGITYGRIPEGYDLARVLTTWRELGAIDIEPLTLPLVIG